MRYDSFLKPAISATKQIAKSVTDNEIRSAYNDSHRPPSLGYTAPDVMAPRVEDVLVDEEAVVVRLGNKCFKIPFYIKDGQIGFDDTKSVEVAREWMEAKKAAGESCYPKLVEFDSTFTEAPVVEKEYAIGGGMNPALPEEDILTSADINK